MYVCMVYFSGSRILDVVGSSVSEKSFVVVLQALTTSCNRRHRVVIGMVMVLPA